MLATCTCSGLAKPLMTLYQLQTSAEKSSTGNTSIALYYKGTHWQISRANTVEPKTANKQSLSFTQNQSNLEVRVENTASEYLSETADRLYSGREGVRPLFNRSAVSKSF